MVKTRPRLHLASPNVTVRLDAAENALDGDGVARWLREMIAKAKAAKVEGKRGKAA